MLDSLPIPVLLLNKNLAIVASNRQTRDLLGPELAGRSVESVLRDPDFLAAVHPATTQQAFIGGVHDRVGLDPRDIARDNR